MFSIHNESEFEFIEKKSRFIGLLYHISKLEEIDVFLSDVKKQYPGANHYVYAYILDKQSSQKASDDGEPQRTAGYPVLDVLNKNQLNDCLAIVVRYFGGTKLGAGGLIRAYSHTIAETIKKATLTKKVTQFYCSLKTSYEYLGDIERIIREHSHLDHVNYESHIQFFFYLYDHNFEKIKNTLFNHNGYVDHLRVLEEREVYAKVLG